MNVLVCFYGLSQAWANLTLKLKLLLQCVLLLYEMYEHFLYGAHFVSLPRFGLFDHYENL